MNGSVTNGFRDRINDIDSGRGDVGSAREALDDWVQQIGICGVRDELAVWISEPATQERLRSSARETATHYVWPLQMSRNGYSIAINEYKNPDQMGTGYANTIHNHRYSFASLILSGGYRQVWSDVHVNLGQTAYVREFSENTAVEGDIVTVDYDRFHRLTDIGSRTLTLMVKCPAVTAHSLSVDIRTLRVSKHIPVESRVTDLIHALGCIYNARTAQGEAI